MANSISAALPSARSSYPPSVNTPDDNPLLTPDAAAPIDTFTSASGAPPLTPPATPFPVDYQEKRKAFSLHHVTTLEAGGKKFGTIERPLFSWTPRMALKDASGQLLAKAERKRFSWGAQYNFTDGQGRPLGKMKEDVGSALMGGSEYSKYNLYDARDKLLGTCTKFQASQRTQFEVRDPSGVQIASSDRGFFNFLGDKWKNHTEKPGVIDPRILAFIPALKSNSGS